MPADRADSMKRVWCGPDDPPRGTEHQKGLRLSSIPPNQNVHLRADNISSRLVQNLPSIALDLLEVAAYIYSSDQSATRGGATLPNNGKGWYREYVLSIPVRCPEVWSQPGVSGKLTELLNWLAEDRYEFDFRRLTNDIARKTYFRFEGGEPWFKPDSVLLFSGGLDSLGGAVEELQDPDKRVILVSHRSVSKIDKPQRELAETLCTRFNARSRILHVPVWVNKQKALSKDANQRSRSFLFASLATVVAAMSGSRTIKFYENGIVSSNLPPLEQIVGARASRSTHPKSLKLMSEFFSELLQDDFKVVNPFFHKTKSDVLKVFKDRDCTEMIRESRSCAKTMAETILHTHCGVCSQCIERRLATLHNGLESDDPEEAYKIRLFTDPLEKKDDHTMVAGYIQHARTLETVGIEDFYEQYVDGFAIADALDMPLEESVRSVHDLHSRHGKQVGRVIKQQIVAHAESIRTREVKPKSLLDMLLTDCRGKPSDSTLLRFPTPAGVGWSNVSIDVVSKDSIRVRAGEITKTYMGAQIGFLDKRRGDMLNGQWDLLTEFAETDGTLSWNHSSARRGKKKSVQALNLILKSFFGLSDNPIGHYRKDVGWVFRAKIRDCRGGIC